MDARLVSVQMILEIAAASELPGTNMANKVHFLADMRQLEVRRKATG